jgi:hypothetical protein
MLALTRSEALLRAATYLKWFRDRAIRPDVDPPEDIGEIIVVLEQLADQLKLEHEPPSQPV